MSSTTGDNIYLGDILRLNQGEVAPCDILVIAAPEVLNGKFICRVDGMFDDGSCYRQTREAISLTKYINHLTEEDKSIPMFLSRYSISLTAD